MPRKSSFLDLWLELGLGSLVARHITVSVAFLSVSVGMSRDRRKVLQEWGRSTARAPSVGLLETSCESNCGQLRHRLDSYMCDSEKAHAAAF